MSTSGIHFSGIASGLNIDSIVQAMVNIYNIPITDMQTQQQNLQTEQTAFTAISSSLQNLSQTLTTLSAKSTFSPVSASVGDSSVATITTGSTAKQGSYNLTVGTLAQAQKVASAAQSDATSALNFSGQFVIDGKTVTVASTDSLSSIASQINGLGIGANASVINGGSGQAYLSIGATQTGTANALQLADASGGVLGSLGILTGAATLRNSPSTNTGLSYNFASSTNPVGSALGLSTSGSISINGTAVNINLSTDSLQTIANSINQANTGVSASVISATTNGTTSYKLQLSGAGVTSMSDPNNILASIGMTQQSAGHQLLGAQDATFTLDTLNLTSSTNQISNVVPGVTLNLLKANSSTTINLTQNTSQITSAITSLQSAYNSAVDTLNQASSYDPTSGSGGPLIGNSTVGTIQRGLQTKLFANSGNGTYSNLSQIGVSLDQSGHMQIDSTKLNTALTTNLAAVQSLLTSTGSSSTAGLTYVSSTPKSISSTGGGYDVNITQPATKATFGGSVAQTSPLATPETLTFSGQLFGSTNYTLSLNAGMSASDIVNMINSDSVLKNDMTASLDSNGVLQLASARYGTSGNFSVSSSVAASTASSGLGSGTAINGLDTAGTINGEAATGSGQYLIGNIGNKTTEGLQVLYTGTTAGVVGSVSYNAGAAQNLNSVLTSYTDSVNGLLTAANNGLQSQVDNLTKQITKAQADSKAYQTYLQQKFTAMESALSALQAQSSSLSAFSGLTSSSTTSTGTSTGTSSTSTSSG